MQKTVSVEGVEYVLNTMKTGDALNIQDEVDFGSLTDARRRSVRRTFLTVAASLQKSPEEVRALPWPVYLELIPPALEVNGMKLEALSDSGETQAGASPAA